MDVKEAIERLKLCSTNQCNICGRYEKEECMLERNRCERTVLSELEQKDEIINLMALAILNYDDQLVINRYRNINEVKETFEEYFTKKCEGK